MGDELTIPAVNSSSSFVRPAAGTLATFAPALVVAGIYGIGIVNAEDIQPHPSEESWVLYESSLSSRTKPDSAVALVTVDRAAFVRSLRGKYRDLLTPSEEFMRLRAEEAQQE